jgi:DeoR C terminal sensor domain
MLDRAPACGPGACCCAARARPAPCGSGDGIEAKQRIAAEAAWLIAEGESVVIDSGATCLEVASALRHHRITVMPLSRHAANALADRG